ncbi:hypothetical protein BDV36DRAFT_250943 [Aspergillus pseudocaelatus]|uniref:Uncharacterized protein n=1 Tax=Aspergillus pseudocaelatus TaxID=1825620 RepID=A0ABQ6WRH5_9EURO|nr:hypothetical protein BDV36DRAFT_250943 [Aspergillus pseudocaelatus]
MSHLASREVCFIRRHVANDRSLVIPSTHESHTEWQIYIVIAQGNREVSLRHRVAKTRIQLAARAHQAYTLVHDAASPRCTQAAADSSILSMFRESAVHTPASTLCASIDSRGGLPCYLSIRKLLFLYLFSLSSIPNCISALLTKMTCQITAIPCDKTILFNISTCYFLNI